MQPTNALITRVQAGAAWIADTQVQQLAVAGYLRFKITNNGPNNAYIYSFGGQASSATTFKVQKNISTAVTTNNVSPSNQNLASNNSSSLAITWDTNASDLAGTYFRSIPVPAGDFKIFNDNIILLGPGQSIGMSAPFILNATGIFHLAWFEQPN